MKKQLAFQHCHSLKSYQLTCSITKGADPLVILNGAARTHQVYTGAEIMILNLQDVHIT